MTVQTLKTWPCMTFKEFRELQTHLFVLWQHSLQLKPNHTEKNAAIWDSNFTDSDLSLSGFRRSPAANQPPATKVCLSGESCYVQANHYIKSEFLLTPSSEIRPVMRSLAFEIQNCFIYTVFEVCSFLSPVTYPAWPLVDGIIMLKIGKTGKRFKKKNWVALFVIRKKCSNLDDNFWTW